MPKAWRVLVVKGAGQKHPYIVALSNLADAEAAAVNKAGGGEAVVRGSVSDAQYEELGLSPGDVVNGPAEWR
jgi:hypothetical protein